MIRKNLISNKVIINVFFLMFGFSQCLLASENLKSNIFKTSKLFVQKGHTGIVSTALISPNKKYIVSSGTDKVIIIWDAKSGKEIKRLRGHTSGVQSLSFSPDGSFLVSGSSDKTIKLWDLKRGDIIKVFKGHTEIIHSVVYSPDGKFILSAGKDRTIKLWNVKSGLEIRTYYGHTSPIHSIAISPDGKYILSGDGEYFNSNRGVVNYWDLRSGKLINSYEKHFKTVSSVAFGSNGKYAVSGSYDKTIRLLDLKNMKEFRVFKGHTDAVSSVSFSADGQHVLSGSDDNTIRLWNVRSNKVVKILKGHNNGVSSVKFVLNDKYALSSSGDSSVKLWDLYTNNAVSSFQGYSSQVGALSISPDGKNFISGGANGVLNNWDLEEGVKVRTYENNLAPVNSLAYSPDGKHFLSGGGIFTKQRSILKQWNVEEKVQINSSVEKNGLIRGVAYSTDGNYIVSGNNSNMAELRETDNFTVINTLKGHSGAVSSVKFSPDGKYILTSSHDKTLKLWNASTGMEIKSFKGHLNLVQTVAFSPNGKYILSGSFDGLIKLWDINQGIEISSFSGHSGSVESVAFSPNGKYILSGSRDNTIRLWETDKSHLYTEFLGHSSDVTSVVFSPNGKYFLSSSRDNTVKLWSMEREIEILSMISFNDGEWVSITPEGYFNASKNGTKHISIQTDYLVVSSIDQYYEAFYRPDIIKAALQDRQIQTGVKLVDVRLAPIVEIINTVSSTKKQDVDISLKITKRSGGLGQVRLYLNGVAIATDNVRALKRISNKNIIHKNYKIKLTKGRNKIKAIAFNKDNNMQSKDAIHIIDAKFKEYRKPSIHALVVGIKEFKNPKLKLNYSVADAELFKQTIQSKHTSLFNKINVTYLVTKEATTKNRIIKEFEKMKKINPSDLFIFYVASHGTVDDGEYFLITSNVGSTSTRRLKKDALSQNTIKELIANIPTTKKFIVLDTCNAAALGDSIQMAVMTRGMSEDTAMKVLSRAVGSTILSAATSQQEALEGYKGHGLFTYVLTEGLKGKADLNKDGFVKTTEIADYLDDEVPEIAERVFKRAQYPTISPSGNAFPITRQ